MKPFIPAGPDSPARRVAELKISLLLELAVPPFFPGEKVSFHIDHLHRSFRELGLRNEITAAELVAKVTGYNSNTGTLYLDCSGYFIQAHFEHQLCDIQNHASEWFVRNVKSLSSETVVAQLRSQWLRKVKRFMGKATSFQALQTFEGGHCKKLSATYPRTPHSKAGF